MHRLTRTLAGCGLALLATATGCHNVREEVPPHHKFRNDGRPVPASSSASASMSSPVEFSTDPHLAPASAMGPVGGNPGNMAPTGSATSSSASPGNAYGNLTTGNKFGGVGSSGLGQAPPMTTPAPAPASAYPPQPPARAEIPGMIPGQSADAPPPI